MKAQSHVSRHEPGWLDGFIGRWQQRRVKAVKVRATPTMGQRRRQRVGPPTGPHECREQAERVQADPVAWVLQIAADELERRCASRLTHKLCGTKEDVVCTARWRKMWEQSRRVVKSRSGERHAKRAQRYVSSASGNPTQHSIASPQPSNPPRPSGANLSQSLTTHTLIVHLLAKSVDASRNDEKDT